MPGDSDQQVTVKTENGSTFKRLPSFRTPRDLKLLEFRDIRSNVLNDNRTKKVFVPNLNVQRKKQTDGDKETSHGSNDVSKQSQKDRGRRDERSRGRGRGKRPLNFIQGSGVFSEGLAPTLKHWNNNRSNEASTSIPKPRLNPKESRKVDKEEEEQVIKELLRDDVIEDPDNQPDLHHCPIKLPLQDCKTFVKCEVDGTFPKQECLENSINGIKVKEEPDTYDESPKVEDSLDVPETKPFDLKNMRPLTVHELLSKSTDNSFFFLQIPNCLPNMKINVQSTVNHSKKDGQKTDDLDSNECVLRNLPPGRIGKIQILKSGRARLILGDVKLWVESGIQTAFKQDLISVNLDTNNKTGNMINMGEITTRMLVTPDWEYLLSKCKQL